MHACGCAKSHNILLGGIQAHNKKNTCAYDAHAKKRTDGTQVVMRNVAVVAGAKTQYMSASLRVTGNLALTRLTGVWGTTSAVQSVPRTNNEHTKGVLQNQPIDLTAFILSHGPTRRGGENRHVIDHELADGSKDKTSGKMQTLRTRVFVDDSEVAASVLFVTRIIGNNDPVTIFNLRGSRTEGTDTYIFSSARRGFHMITAESQRATDMRSRASELYSLSVNASNSTATENRVGDGERLFAECDGYDH